MPDPMQQLHIDVAAIVAEVERLTGLNSNWSGRVIIGNEVDASGVPAYLGAKPWNCDIVLHQSLLALLSRYSTLIHEVFHSVSVGLNEPDYRAWKGYEEGVVEQCNRLWRAVILANTSLPLPIDARTSYNDRIVLLESLRTRTQKSEQDFYLSLLQTPLRDREGTITQWIQSIEVTKTFRQIEQETFLLRAGLKR